ncbi:MAG TPA: C25 family cysteine peptidase, partial [Bacteroidia bacterium]|nr:C25 family cysteine peptidase [Bacteroidia bacterium]
TIYYNITYVPNPYLSLFSDTLHAFLTWNNLTTNSRITLETDTASYSYTPAPYFYTEKVFTNREEYNYVEEYSNGTSDARYTQAEGWGIGVYINNPYGNSVFNTSISSINMYSVAPLPVYVKINFSGSSVDGGTTPYDHEIKGVIYDGTNTPVKLFDTLFRGYKYFKYNFTLQSNTLGNGSNVEVSSIANPMFSTIENRTALHCIYYKYPQTPDLGGSTFSKLMVDDDATQPKTYLKITGASTGPGTTLLFHDLTNKKKFVYKTEGGYTKILVPNSGNQKVCYIGAEIFAINISSLTLVNQTGFFTNFKATMADSAFVIISHGSFMAEANNYKTYRQTFAGGSHKVILADIDEVRDQFGYGAEQHPLVIRNFCRFLIDSLPSPPKNLFLIGKGLQHRDLLNPYSWPVNLIPSMGIAPSDNLLTAGLKTNDFVTPEVPVGRLAAKVPSDVSNYLLKVQQHENPVGCPPPDNYDWKKHVLHFAGGTDAAQQAQFESYLNIYKGIIQDTSYGGIVYDFKKTTTAPIQITISDSVKNHWAYGVSLVTFFGHGSYVGFDQAIDDPNSYNNVGKYPLFIANSCYSGNIHTYNITSTSEKFVLANQKGSIAFIAATSLGFVGALHFYTDQIYRGLSYKYYNKSIGLSVKNACYQSSLIGDPIQHFTAMDMTLHGDPSIRISPGGLPDYTINNSSVEFDTKTKTDSLGITIYTTNLGKAIKDSIIVRIERTFPNGDSVTIFKNIKAPYLRDTLQFFTAIDFTRGIGLNKFKVKVDAYSAVTESCENNNSTQGTVDVFIQGGDITPVYPYKYAVIPTTSTITLKASTADPFSGTRNYRMQLDTTDAFTSPLTATLIASSGGVVEWTVSLPFADSTVYYWRVTKDSISPQEGYVWKESSFQTITTKHGWGQSHFFQFKNDGYQFVKYKRPLRKFVFENDVMSLFVRTGIIYNIDPLAILYSLNGSVKNVWNCEWNGWTLAVFDSVSGKPWVANSAAVTPTVGPFGDFLCFPSAQQLFTFDFGYNTYNDAVGNIHPTWTKDLNDFIDAIPPNNKVLAYSAQNHGSSSFSNSLYTAFESFGSGKIRTLKDTTPLIIFGRKGMKAGYAHEVEALNSYVPIQLDDSISTKWNSGFIASEIIGPGYKWNSFHWKVRSLEAAAGDTTIVKIVGIKANGAMDTLVTFTQDSLNVLDLKTYADANVYPYLKLIAFEKDNVFRTSPQLKYWYVLYDEAPECAINPKKGFKTINDTLQEGDNVTMILPIENVGTIPFTDSLVITYWIEDASRVIHNLPQKLKAKPYNPGAVILDTIKVNSYLYPGNNALWIDVNPPQNTKYQKEQYHFNNIARYAFSVKRDITNPLLDVTFDGVRIMNGDVVSAKPYILINLKDENKFLALNDTSAFVVFIKKPNDLVEQRIYFANGLKFTPAQLPNNSCKIEYNPALVQDGKHLLIVQGKDRSRNQSGAIDYRITFDVINKSTITQVVNYPNPFSTSTRFVFNLTGSEVPETFNIQIMTITGKIVKTIMKDELGPLHVGRNITEYAWDGKDDFGDKLANGVYLYKVQTKINGQNIEHQSTELDGYFKKEIGKMVIMR